MNSQDPLYTNADVPTAGFVQPTLNRRLPFPLENTEEELISAIQALDSVKRKILHCKQYNGVSKDAPRKKHLDKMIYKCNTIELLVKALTQDLNEMYL
jgi:hypothetical protein